MLETNIKERLAELDPEYVTFLKSEFINKISALIEEETDFPKDKIKHLSNGLTLFLLISLKVEDFISFLEKECGLDHEKALGISGILFNSLPNNLLGAQSEAYFEINSNKKTNVPDKEAKKGVIPSISQDDLLKR